MTTAVLLGFLGGAEVLLIIILFFVLLISIIFYILTLQNTLKEVSPENRQMEPGQVWLLLIPLFNLVWRFIVVNKIADSLRAEFADRQINVDEDRPGYSIGIAYCILPLFGIIPILGTMASIAGLVCWIIYWVKMHDYKTKLIQDNNKPINYQNEELQKIKTTKENFDI
jgi:hypothetical protein